MESMGNKTIDQNHAVSKVPWTGLQNSSKNYFTKLLNDVCVCVYTYACIYVCVWGVICVCMWGKVCVYGGMCVYEDMCVWVCGCVYTLVYMYLHICVPECSYVCVPVKCLCLHMCACVCMSVCACVWSHYKVYILPVMMRKLWRKKLL